MCCLRYEDKTYEELRKNLPYRNTRVLTEEGPGRVVATQVLTQLVQVELEETNTRIAVPVEQVEQISEDAVIPPKKKEPEPRREGRSGGPRERTSRRDDRSKSGDRAKPSDADKPREDKSAEPETKASSEQAKDDSSSDDPDKPKRRRRRRRRRGGRGRKGGGEGGNSNGGGGSNNG